MTHTKERLSSISSNQLAALKRYQLWIAKNRQLPRDHRVNMIGSTDAVLCYLCLAHGPELTDVLLEAFVSVVDRPDLRQDDFMPLFQLAAALKQPTLKAFVRSLGQQAMMLAQ